MNSNKKTRESNIELLRIFASMGVIILHYTNGGIGGGTSFVSGTVNVFVMHLYQAIAFCAVDLFIMISGYFLCATQKRKISKVFLFCFQASFFSCVHYLLICLFGGDTWSLYGMVKSLIALGYFIVLYSVTYIISPLINIVLNQLESKSIKNSVFVLFIIFSVISSIIDVLSSINFLGIQWNGISTVSNVGSLEGYSITNFLLCYFIGAYIRKTEINLKTTKLLKLLLFSVSALVAWSYIDWKSAYTYNNPLVIIEGALLLCIFLSVKIQSKLINELSRSVFSCYLAHIYFFNLLHIEFHVKSGCLVFTLHMLASVTLLYLICHLLYLIYSFLTSKFTKWISNVLDDNIRIQYFE